MKILYISNYPLSGTLSPSINEIGFVTALNDKFQQNIMCFIADSASEINIPKERLRYFKTVPLSKIFSYFIHTFQWVLKARKILSDFEPDIIIIRTRSAPLKEILLTLLTNKKIILKSSAKYWMDGKPLGIVDLYRRKLDLLLCRKL